MSVCYNSVQYNEVLYYLVQHHPGNFYETVMLECRTLTKDERGYRHSIRGEISQQVYIWFLCIISFSITKYSLQHNVLGCYSYTHVLNAFPSVWSSLLTVNIAAFGTLVSFSITTLTKTTKVI